MSNWFRVFLVMQGSRVEEVGFWNFRVLEV